MILGTWVSLPKGPILVDTCPPRDTDWIMCFCISMVPYELIILHTGKGIQEKKLKALAVDSSAGISTLRWRLSLLCLVSALLLLAPSKFKAEGSFAFPYSSSHVCISRRIYCRVTGTSYFVLSYVRTTFWSATPSHKNKPFQLGTLFFPAKVESGLRQGVAI